MSASMTVLIPVKNGMPWLPQTLASLESQTFRGFELLVWDNGSVDGTVEELRRWIPNRLPGRIVTDRPLPLGPCRAAMVEAAQTELCAWMDADDTCHPDRFALQLHFMTQHPGVAVVSANLDLIDAEGTLIPGAWRYATGDADIRWSMRFTNGIAQGAAMFRRSVLLAAGNYRDIAPGQDYDMWVRVAQVAPLANLPEVLLYYRRHTTNITRHETAQTSRQRQHDIVEMNIAGLFPGIDPHEAIELRRIIVEHRADNVRLKHIRLLRTAAIAAARQARQPDDYFLRTPLCRRQMWDLVSAWLKQHRTIRHAWPFLRGTARLVRLFPAYGFHDSPTIKKAA